MSDSTEAKMQPLSSMDDDELMVSGSRYSIKSSRLRPNSGIKCLAGCSGHSQVPTSGFANELGPRLMGKLSR
nr:OLLAS epitope-tagged SIGN-R1 cytosolic domain [synthetic construct]